MPAVWTEDNTIGNALAGVSNAMYGGPMLQLKTMEIMQGLRQRNLEYQRLQQEMAKSQQQTELSRQIGDQATQLFGSGADSGLIGSQGPMAGASQGPSPSAGIGNIGVGDGQSSPSPSVGSATQQPLAGPAAAGTQGAAATQGVSNAAYRSQLAKWYSTNMQLAALNGNLDGVRQLAHESSQIMGENFGAANASEALALHHMYSNLKGPEANLYASQLETHLQGGGQLTIPQARFMGLWAGAAAPLTYEMLPSGEQQARRAGMPVSSGMLSEMARNGVTLPGLEAGPQAAAGGPQGAPGAPGPAGAPQPSALPTGLAGPRPSYYDQKNAEAVRADPVWQMANEQTSEAANVLQALSQGTTLGDRVAIAAVLRTMIPNARTNLPAGSVAAEDLLSKSQIWKEQFEKYLTTGNRLLPENVRAQIAQFAIGQAATAKSRYDSYYEPQRAAYRARGGNDEVGIPRIPALTPPDLTGSEGGSTTAPKPRTTQDDLEKLIGR